MVYKLWKGNNKDSLKIVERLHKRWCENCAKVTTRKLWKGNNKDGVKIVER